MNDGTVSEGLEIPGKVQQRVATIERELRTLDANIALLQDFAEGRWTLKNKGYTRRAAHYRQTAEDKARLPKTLANLNAQRALLHREREVLLEYGV